VGARELDSVEVGIPEFAVEPSEGNVFALDSHKRAKEALDFGMSTREPGFDILVVGADRSGRLTQTLHYLQEEMKKRSAPPDWIYLNNFRRPHRPRAYKLPAGTGRRFRERMAALIPDIRASLQRTFEDEAHQAALQAPGKRLQEEVNRRIAEVRTDAEGHGLTIVQTQSGPAVSPGEEIQQRMNDMKPEEAAKIQAAAEKIAEQLSEIARWAAKEQRSISEHTRNVSHQFADEAICELTIEVSKEFEGHGGLQRWLEEMRMDVLENIQRFASQQPEGAPPVEPPELRYAVNVFVDNSENEHPLVVLEANPTYENLFGRSEYRQTAMRFETDFSLLRAGALHRANGGVLMLRAEALAAAPFSWLFLKAALRDREIQIEDLRQQSSIPIAGAPRPKPIPLDLKVVLIGAPRWFQTYFNADPDFQTYFRVKAEIDIDMPADPENLSHYGGLLERLATEHGAEGCTPDAIARLLGEASRLAEDRTKLSSRFEMLEDIIAEARVRTPEGPITEACVETAIQKRRERNARTEDHMHERIADGIVLIETSGTVVGQVNGMTVRNSDDHAFGGPARVTARASVGRAGIVNIEREIAMGGPIQQKAAMILQGYLTGQFARKIPLSFTSSITFEQSYGGVEGDSASLAEAVAIISDLSGLGVRQDIAITGSMNQRGEAQVVGGVAYKVEGFFRTCRDKADGLTGSQGLIVPSKNARSLVLDDEVQTAVSAGRFHVWTVAHVEEALELLLDAPCGTADEKGDYPPDSIFGRVIAQLSLFNEALAAAAYSRSFA
jgi:predicted ATP-dependent protease